jgi:hypothetical protein
VSPDQGASDSKRPHLNDDGLEWYAQAVNNALKFLTREGFHTRQKFIDTIRPVSHPGQVNAEYVQWCLVAMGITPQEGHEAAPVSSDQHQGRYLTDVTKMTWFRSLTSEAKRSQIHHHWNILWGGGRLPDSL